jgi:Tol biopolymer transport system component/predicted Ser/Thr protein kinase
MPAAGESYGPYEVLAPIGAGGMGEVFKARDRRLDRIVALKTSREQFTDRFAREARAAAALNHPHIATLHDVGPDYLVMEFVEGETLRGPLPLPRALLYARQILQALDAAHRKGIVHCDLKPANILVAKSGIKLLDFGLAQMKQRPQVRDETATMALPPEGMIAGTLQYMAPEQLQGKPPDARTDIFAFGLVLYEILTGRRAFEADNAASVISAIMTAEPAPQVAEHPALDRIIRRCLAKDPDERWQSAADIAHALDLVETAPAAAEPPQRKGLAWWWPAAAFVAGALIVFGLTRLQHPPEAPQWTFHPVTYSGEAFQPSLSPDGKQVVYTWLGEHSKNGLYVQLVTGGNPVLLPVAQVRGRPAWSPDGNQIAFIADHDLNVMAALGGTPRRIALFPSGTSPANVAWSPNGKFFAVDSGGRRGIAVVPVEGGEIRPLTKPDPATDDFPAISPDGRAIAFVRHTSAFVSAIVVLPISPEGTAAGPEQTITTGVWQLGTLDWTADSSAIIFQGSAGSNNPSLWRIPRGGGTPVRLVTPSTISIDPSIARQGSRMVYVAVLYNVHIFKFAPGGAREPESLVDAIGEHRDLAVSADGSHIAFVSNRTGVSELWTAKSDGTEQTQLTSFEGPALGSPRWSPDGSQIAFDGYAAGSADIYVIPSAGGKPVRLTTDSGNEVRPSWSHDGQWVYYGWEHPGRSREIWKVRPSGGEPVRVAAGGNAYETPDGQWLYVVTGPKLRRMHPDGSGETELPVQVPGPNYWNIGGRSVYVLSGLDLLRVPFATSTVEKAFHFTEANAPDGNGNGIAFPNDESFGIYRRAIRKVITLMRIDGFR